MNALPSSAWTSLIRVNACSVAPRAGVEAASFPQVLQRPNQEGNEENNKYPHNLVTHIMYHTMYPYTFKRRSH